MKVTITLSALAARALGILLTISLISVVLLAGGDLAAYIDPVKLIAGEAALTSAFILYFLKKNHLQIDHAQDIFAARIRDRLIRQLTSANEQLEQFAYVASHDLREPLRIVVSFSDLLSKEYGDRLDDEGRQYLSINRRAAMKMEAMVADLLEYSRLGQSSERFMEIDCDKVLQQAVEALGEAVSSTKAVIEHAPLPVIAANPMRLSRLFQNLIGNALKYQAPGATPMIKIGAEEQGDLWRFAVADNGIGIGAAYIETIFAPFKRLHNDQQYAGTGIGLAICRRIVENLGGKIWAQSIPGQGSVFYFTIPKRGTAGKS